MKITPFLLCLPLLAPAQPVHQQAYWVRLYLRMQLGPRLTLHSEADERRFAWPDGQWQFITHQHLHYRASPRWDLALGGTYSRQPQGEGSVPELRLFEEATATLPLPGHLRLQPRLRVEQCWSRPGAIAADQLGSWNYRSRFRGRLQLDWQLDATWKLRTSDELMVTTRIFDQNRLYAGAERQLGSGLALELGYLWIWQRRNATYFDHNVLRITLFKDLALGKPR